MISYVEFNVDQIEKMRKEISAISMEIRDLLLKRRMLSLKIQNLKQEKGLSKDDPLREQEILLTITEGLALSERKYICEIFREIFSQSKK